MFASSPTSATEGTPTSTKVDKDLLREFYRSGASNFAAFKKAKAQQASASPESTSTAAAIRPKASKKERPRSPQTTGVQAIRDLAASSKSGSAGDLSKAADQKAQAVSCLDTTTTSSTIAAPAAPSPVKAKPGKGAESGDISQMTVEQQAAIAKEGGLDTAGIDAASSEYILFLKQQQELQHCHRKLEDTLGEFERDRRDLQSEVGKVRGQASTLLSTLEQGTNWNLSSKYNVQQLLKDAQLKLQPRELFRPEMQPKYLEVVQQAANLQKLKQDHSSKEQYVPFKATIDSGARRLERVEKEIRGSQLDATDLARLPDTLFIQMDHVLEAPTIHMELMDTEEKLEHLLFKLDETKEARAIALDDGEMQLAEKKYYNVVEVYEEILELVLAKLSTIERTQKESVVFDKVREQYQQKAAEEATKLTETKDQLKKRCEADLKKIFSLKERVDSVEAATVEKLLEERKRSDQFLADNSTQQQLTWAKIEDLERELQRLEKERYSEFKKRILDKDKDEHRRMEYEKFCSVVDSHSQLLDLTIRNCDTAIHCTALVAEFVNSGFNTLGTELANKNKDLGELLVETHKQHLEMFRGLYLSLGELAHKKDKRIEEIDKAIQTSHIQQELAAETLNPNAKKYSDAKKELLRVRDNVEEDLTTLKEKAQAALSNFTLSEQALHDAGIDFVHPTVEQQEQELETKAKMVEYKAIATGHVDALPIKAELETLKSQLNETKEFVKSINRSTVSSATVLPLIRAGTPTSYAAAASSPTS